MAVHLMREVESLKKKILRLSTIVEENVERAVRSVEKRDADLARKVVEEDKAVDKMEIDVEEDCLKVLALHQPVATDLLHRGRTQTQQRPRAHRRPHR